MSSKLFSHDSCIATMSRLACNQVHSASHILFLKLWAFHDPNFSTLSKKVKVLLASGAWIGKCAGGLPLAHSSGDVNKLNVLDSFVCLHFLFFKAVLLMLCGRVIVGKVFM